MPFTVRRTYLSQHPALGSFGVGWKQNHTPFLIVSDDERLITAADADGALLVYEGSPTNGWRPTVGRNPDLCNNSESGIGSSANRFNSWVDRTVDTNGTVYRLTGADRSVRRFEVRSFPLGTNQRTRPYLTEWRDHRGNSLRFAYGTATNENDYGRVRRVQSSSGSYLGFNYNSDGMIVEAYASDGRRLYYDYDRFANLTRVTLPDASEIQYDYEYRPEAGKLVSTYLLLRETKPGGRQLENVYDNLRRVTVQRATVGPDLNLYTNALFAYSNNFTTLAQTTALTGFTLVTDAFGNVSRYDYANNLICRVTDPLLNTIEQVWYPDNTNAPGCPRSLWKKKDQRGFWTEYQYDAAGNVVKATVTGDLTGGGATNETCVTTLSYVNGILPSVITNASGLVSKYFYDDALYPYLATRLELYACNGVDLATNFFVYTNASEVSANGTTVVTNQAHGLLAREVRAGNAVSESAYDGRGFLTQRVRHVTTADYPTNADPDPIIWFSHNGRGELIEQRTGAGHRTRFEYDARGNVVAKEVFAAGQQTPLAWDHSYYNENGELAWTDGPRFDPEDYVWRDYDGAGRKIEEVRWRSRAKADGTGVEAEAGDALYALSTWEYDLFGNVVRQTDALGNYARLRYDALGQMVEQRFYEPNRGTPLRIETLGYEPGGQVAAQTNGLGGYTLRKFTSTGKVCWQRNPDGSTNRWTYYLDGRLRREYLANGSYWETLYDDAARTVTRLFKNTNEAVLATESKLFDRRGNLIQSTDALTNQFTTIYDGLDRPKESFGPSTAPQQHTITYYDALDTTTTVVNAHGERTISTRDPLGRSLSVEVQDAGGNPIRYSASAYSANHHRTTTVAGTGDGAVVNTVYTDTFGAPVLNVSAIPDQFSLNAYDLLGRLVVARDELGRTNRFTFDVLGRRVRTELPDGAVNSFAYDAVGNVLTNTLPNGMQAVAVYDAASRVMASWLQQGATRTLTNGFQYYSNGPVGLLQQVTDGRGLTRVNTYDPWLRLQQQDWPGLSLTWEYDRLGRTISLAQSGGATDPVRVDRAFDGYGQMTMETITTNGVVFSQFTQTWDAAGRRSSLGFPNGQWDFDYWADGLMAAVTAFGQSYTYAYSNNGQLMQRITPDRVWTAGQRDARGRLLEATTAVNGTNVLVETMHWRANSTLNDYSAARPGTWNETRNYGYNPRGQLTNETLKPSASGSLNASYGYDTNRLGVLTSATFAGSFNNAWLAPSGQPDGFGRVTEEQWDLAQRELWTQGHAPGAGQVSVALDGQPLSEVRYDPNQPDGLWEGRMAFGPGSHSLVATATHLSGLVTAATTNAFTASTTNALTEAYDGIGNVTNRTLPGGRVQTLGWDPLGRLVSITERVDTATNWTWTATYDPFSRRLSSTYRPLTINDPPSTIHQFYDPQVEFLEIGVSLNGVRTWKIHGPDLNGRYGGLMGVGGLEATVRESDSSATGLLSDAFGNGVATINSGVVTWTPVPVAGYGPVLGYAPPQLSDYHTLAEVSLWRGQRIDPTGLYWRGTRYYDARAGRFLSPDPLGHAASWDLYSFANGDPITYDDPDGRISARQTSTTATSQINQQPSLELGIAPVTVTMIARSYANPDGTETGPILESILTATGEPVWYKASYVQVPTGEQVFYVCDTSGGHAVSWRPDSIPITALDLEQQQRLQCLEGIVTILALAEAGGAIFEAAGLRVLAAETKVLRNPNVYEALFEAPVSGTSRAAHRASANEFLANQLRNDAQLNGMFNQQLGGNVLQHMESGSSLLNPAGTVWHHPFDNPNVMQLLRTGEHTAPPLQPVLHPGGVGGFGNFYGP